ncbi:MAG TPA: SDR family NAD(P)-dependent oxidoreductase, partial [Mycobacteriales bacterium]
GAYTLVECGPGRQLAGLARGQVPPGGLPPLPSLPGPRDAEPDLAVLAGTAGRLWTVGVPLADGAPGPVARRVPLPTYPYERRRLWVDPDPAGTVAAPTRTGAVPVEDWFRVPSWRQDAPAVTPAPFARCLAFTAGRAGDALVAALRRSGVDVVEVVAGDGYGIDPAGRYTVRPGDRPDLEKLVADLAVGGGVPERVVHAWPLDGEPAGTDVAAAWRAQDLGFLGLLGLAQALAGGGLSDPVHLDVLTAGTEDVTGTDLTRPEHATVAGIARVLPLEVPGLTVRHVDADAAGGGRVVADLVGELFRAPGGTSGPVVLRGGRRWVRDHLPVRVPPASDPAGGLRERGVYVVTGGLGGLGLTLAEDLARRVRARLVLVSRTGPAGEGAAAAVRRMEAAGAEVLVLAADITDPAEVRRVREAARERWGRVDGLLHAAGVAGGGMAELKDRAVAERVLAPKLTGTLALAQAFGGDDLDVVVLFSSVTAVAGGVGQVDYCAANAFLDAVARARHGFACRVVSVDWGGWLEVGMAADAARSARSAEDAADAGAVGEEPVDHPLLRSRRAAGDGRFFCSARLSAGSTWLLDEHRVGGVPVLPGTAVLELAHAAATATTTPPSPGAVLELRDVSFVRPVTAPEGTTVDVQVTVTPGPDGADLEVSGPGGFGVYAVATAAWVDPAPPRRHDLAALLARLTPEGPAPQDGEDGLVRVGPHWPVPARVHAGDREQVALIELADPPAGEPGGWHLNPAVLDRAVAFPRLDGGPGWLPLGYGRIVAVRPLPAKVWSHVRYTGGTADDVVTADVTVLDEDGEEIASVTDFLLRRVDPAAGAPGAPGAPAASAASAAPPAARERSGEERGILPADGAEAFARLLATDLGPQVVVSAVPLEEILAGVAGSALAGRSPDPDEDDLPEQEGQPRAVDGDYVAPRTDLEATLARIWGEVLGIGEVGVEDDFFELGGNSLLGVQLVAQVRRAVGAKLPMRTLFDEPTVAGIAARIAALGGPAGPDSDDSIPRLPRS